MPKNEIYLDDSSDEEKKPNITYNLFECFNAFNKGYSANFFDKKNDIPPLAQYYYFPFSFASHALGIAILGNKKSRELYKDSKGYVTSIDKSDIRITEFEKYLRLALDKTIYELCCKSFTQSAEQKKSDSTIEEAHKKVLILVKEFTGTDLINEAVGNCLSDPDFYKNLSANKPENILKHFENLIDFLHSNVSNILTTNASEGGFEKEGKLFKSWSQVVKYPLVEKVLITKLVETKPAREVLPTSSELVNSDSKSFIANILTTDRSDKRRIRNLDDFDLYQNGEQETYRSWFFKSIGSCAVEQSTISRNNQNRLSWIGNIKGYDDIFKVINNMKSKIKEKYKISFADKLLAQAIRGNLNGEKLFLIDDEAIFNCDRDQIKELVASLTQLFFGLETVRNPSSIIINQMALDLIIDYQYSFQQMLTRGKDVSINEFLIVTYQADQLETENYTSSSSSKEEEEAIGIYRSGGMMPMSHSGVMAVARKLEACYQEDNAVYMPKSYHYQGSKTTGNKDPHNVQTELQLIVLEGKIVNQWLMLEENGKYKKAIGHISKLISLLESTIKDRVKTKWFKDIEIEQVKHITKKS